MEFLSAFAIGLTFAVGLFQILRRNVVRAAVGLMLLANAINLFLLTAGAHLGRAAPYAGPAAGMRADALPQALILTAIVISLGATAFALGMLYVVAWRYNTCDADEIKGLRH
jgi:multicomponent Na+:H+ antiporter subunit C